MISRLVGRLLRLSNSSVLARFSTYDDQDRGKGSKSSFFSKKSKPRDESNYPSKNQQGQNKESQSKTIKFLKKHELKMKNLQPQNQKELRFKKRTTHQSTQTQKQSPFIKPQRGQTQEQQIQKSIFFSTSSPSTQSTQNRTPQISLPQLNSYLNSPSPSNTFYQRLSQDLDDILSLFENKKWKELNYIVQGYADLASLAIIQKELHSLLINHNAQNYVLWLKKSKTSYNKLSNNTLKKIYNQLIKQQNIKQLTILLQYLLKRFQEQNNQQLPFDLQYSSIQALFSNVQKDGPLNELQTEVNEKIDLSLLILDVQFQFCSYKFRNAQMEQVEIDEEEDQEKDVDDYEQNKHSLDQWFGKIAYLALDRHICQSKFKIIFQQIFLRHFPTLNLQYTYENGLFFRVLETFYYGSYVTTAKIQNLFIDFMNNDLFQTYILKFKQSLIHYKTKTDKFAFPNAKNLLQQFQLAFKQKNLQQALLFFVLVLNSDQKHKNLNQFMKKRQFLVNYCEKYSFYRFNIHSILSDAVFSLNQQKLIGKLPQVKEAQEPGKKKKQSKLTKSSKQKAKKNQLQNQEDKAWDVQESFPKNQVKKTLQQLGWNSGSRKSYYNLLTKQMQNEENPYRKELLMNILNAKLNVREQQFSKWNPFTSTGQNIKQEQIEKRYQQIKKNSYWRPGLTQRQIQRRVRHRLSRQMNFVGKYNKNEIMKQQYDYVNKLAIKSAIKLKKYELALALCEKIIMQPLILERTGQNISLVVKLFLLQENRKKPIAQLDQLLQNIHRSIQQLTPQYLLSVYRRYQNFDQIIQGYTPPNDKKFEFWQATLAFNKAQDLLKMDISNKLKTIKYQAEYQSPPIPKDSFIKNSPKNWRQKLIEELGIIKPIRKSPPTNIIQTNSQEQFFSKFIQKKMLKLDKLKAKGPKQGPVYQNLKTYQSIRREDLQSQLLQGQAQVAENVEGAEGVEGVEGAEGAEGSQQVAEVAEVEGQAVQQAENVQAEAVQNAEDQTVATQEGQSQPVPTSTEEQLKTSNQQHLQSQQRQALAAQQKRDNEQIKAHEQQQKKMQKQMQENQNDLIKNIMGYYSNLNSSESVRIKGYDFTSFLDFAKTKIKPIFQQQYQQQKQFKKHMINLESLTEQSRLQDIHFLQQKLYEYQRSVRSLKNIYIFLNYGLWNYDFNLYSLDPKISISRIKNFRRLFFKFKTYEGSKGFYKKVFKNRSQEIIFNNQRINLTAATKNLQISYRYNQNLVDQLLLRRIRFFKQAQAVIKINSSPQVEQLMLWGLQHDEPMAIYLGQKIAMITNQTISHTLAQRIARYLSHRAEIPLERIEKCKECLKVVGRINRENIYDFNHNYQHITTRKNFNNYLIKRGKQLDQPALEFLARVDPTIVGQEKKYLKNNLRTNLVI